MSRFIFIISSLGSVVLPLICSSCRTVAPGPMSLTSQRQLYQWYDEGGPGEVSIRISLPDQIAEIERGGRPVGWCYVATGKEGHGTRAGSYRIMEKIVDKHSNRYGWIEDEFGNVVDEDASPGDPVPEGAVYVAAPMPYWMRLTSYGIGMHGGYIPDPGKPASHGCIRMPKRFVPVLFDMVDVGTRVTITNVPSRHGPGAGNPPPSDFAGPYRVLETRPLTGAEARRRGPLPARRITDPFVTY